VIHTRGKIALDRKSRRAVAATGSPHRVLGDPGAALDVGKPLEPLVTLRIVVADNSLSVVEDADDPFTGAWMSIPGLIATRTVAHFIPLLL
jgi:hypothetical protein